ncbi:hypothetical protein BHM03_00052838 [Ensete ventricosum]|nr:hypothetical protein BHM03_00052838 [Ensete ventricosum]
MRPASRGCCQQRARKGWSPATSPQGAARGAPARGGLQRPARKGLLAVRPQGLSPLGRSAVGRNAQRRRLRRGSGTRG